MHKVDTRIETIFAHAAAMNQAGRLRNTIYVQDKEVYILNSDRTVLLRFVLPASSSPFANPISFKASDYDSNTFYEEDGRIVFVTKSGDMVRKKSCSTPDLEPADVSQMFSRFKPIKQNRFQMHKNVIPLLNENLSHIEFLGTNGNLMVVQRNIYNGTVLSIEREAAAGFGVNNADDINSDFGPLGLRTTDFLALFAFNDQLTFSFPQGSRAGFCRVVGRNFKMSGVIALCLYDELGIITTELEGSDGRKKSQKRRSQQGSNRPTKGRQRRKR